jgi:hypothetical protein
MSNKPRTQHCPRCHGVGLEETSIGGRSCRKCFGKGRIVVENRFVSEPGDFEVVRGKLIAVSGDRYLEQVSETEGRVIIPSEGYIGPVHSIASIAARGYWEPLVVEVVEKVIRSTTHDHTQKK